LKEEARPARWLSARDAKRATKERYEESAGERREDGEENPLNRPARTRFRIEA
jgi:hypothetical protein